MTVAASNRIRREGTAVRCFSTACGHWRQCEYELETTRKAATLQQTSRELNWYRSTGSRRLMQPCVLGHSCERRKSSQLFASSERAG
ncbi:hypothetical protein F2P81_013738 [Scophthalmus maximus]|uniref:Uncharacterized protein n=1 Tax=Scophthalmus maximus TaxID=52904 RepID=A0A6A4SU96_SCOMX|nr:hypothetical protein F2P81_013738 [Scophthalmus maximus]